MTTGTIQKQTTDMWVQTPDGLRYKIHFSERQRLDLDDSATGLAVEFEVATDIVEPRDFNGWVRNGSLRL